MSDIHNIISQYSNYKQHILPTIKTNKYHNRYHIGKFSSTLFISKIRILFSM